MPSQRIPCVLSIAGSDSGGGAGIQADLKAFARVGVHGMSAITAITAQNTVGVLSVFPVPRQTIIDQVRAVRDDIGVDAVKVGMLGNVETTAAVAEALDLLEGAPVVVDPVMVSESGARLLDSAAHAALADLILPRADVTTPNVPEARALAGRDGHAEGDEADETLALARGVLALGPSAVVLTGGHRSQAVDLYLDGERCVSIPGPRYLDGAAHGSGCTHSSVLAAQLALGHDSLAAARAAREIAGCAVRDGLRDVGSGPGPVDVLGVCSRASEGR